MESGPESQMFIRYCSHTKHTPKKSSNPQIILKRRRYVAVPKILEMKRQNLRFHFQDSRNNPQILGVELGWNYFERRHFEDFFSVCFACHCPILYSLLLTVQGHIPIRGIILWVGGRNSLFLHQ